MEAFNSRLESFAKTRRVKQSSKRTVSIKWPHPAHFLATPDTLTEAGFFYNPARGTPDNVECFFCGKCLDGWEEQDDPFAIHWDKCRDSCAWAVLRCGLSEDVDRKGNFAFNHPSRQPDGKPMEKARLATFRLNESWPHDRVKGHGAHSTKMAKAGFAFTPQTPGDDTGTCLYCRISLSGWDDDDDPLEEHHKRVKKSNLSCPFFPEAPAPKSRSRTTSLRSTARPKSRAGSRKHHLVASEASLSRSDDDSPPAPLPAPSRPAPRSRTTSAVAADKDASDALRRSTRSSRAKPSTSVEEDASGTELRRSTLGQSRSKSSKGKGKGPIEVIEEAEEDDVARAAAPPTKKRVKGKENVAHDVKVPKPTRNAKAPRANDIEEEAHQPKRRLPKKGRGALDESTPDVDSESDARPTGKGRKRVVVNISSSEESGEETEPKVQAPAKKAKGKAPIDVLEPEDNRIETTGVPSRPGKKAIPKASAKSRARPEATEDSGGGSDGEPAKEVDLATSLGHGRDNAQSRQVTPLDSSERSEAATSRSSGEEAVVPFSTPVKNPGEGKSSAITASHHERGRSRMSSGSGGSPESLVPNGKADIASGTSQSDVMDVDADVAPAPVTPRKTRQTTSLLERESLVDVDLDDGALSPPARAGHSPQSSEASVSRREESPATPPPASSSLLSVSSTTSTTKVECHTDTETLVESMPLRTNGAHLTEEERAMTVEQWIRQEIGVQYERLRRDGEMKIRLFEERAEEVRRQIEAL